MRRRALELLFFQARASNGGYFRVWGLLLSFGDHEGTWKQLRSATSPTAGEGLGFRILGLGLRARLEWTSQQTSR